MIVIDQILFEHEDFGIVIAIRKKRIWPNPGEKSELIFDAIVHATELGNRLKNAKEILYNSDRTNITVRLPNMERIFNKTGALSNWSKFKDLCF